jgi:predicted acylesterase/phospholipase RssA
MAVFLLMVDMASPPIFGLFHPVHSFTVDNLPVSTMTRLGASTVFAVDVGSVSISMVHAKRALLNPRFQLVG